MKDYSKTEIRHFKNFQLGNEKAFEYFFNKYHSHIFGFCIQFIYDKSQSSSITQEAFLNLWLNRAKIEKVNGIESFLYTFAKSKCLNAIRHLKVKERFKSKTLNEKQRALDLDVLNAINFDNLTLMELEKLITDSIKDLPEKTRIIFLKKRFESKKNKEIADELNITIKTVEAHMTKALKILRVKLSDYLPILLVSIILSNQQ
ncbi:RNA polymerase sigma-70 factor [Polaribacter atrinae]|uniref:RNA polymerase subunit sigma-24 n=1 Tax=Polaribacter atrinae TaxID=1333662 RepID=A0A176THA7_9FLAO|nr:RNA polymerase sigma-70 factor [Polaribacter atrinae]OAD46756.1 RNA polymerase subunit sigma-24 [Polaribacter atrinae]